MTSRDLLDELRQVFRGELEDTLTLLEDEAQALATSDASSGELGRSVAEIYRAVHSLKGAAHAVGYPGLERLCHALESRLAPVRSGGAVDVARVAADLHVVLGALHAAAIQLASSAQPDDEALAAAQRQIEGSGAPASVASPGPSAGGTPIASSAPVASSASGAEGPSGVAAAWPATGALVSGAQGGAVAPVLAAAPAVAAPGSVATSTTSTSSVPPVSIVTATAVGAVAPVITATSVIPTAPATAEAATENAVRAEETVRISVARLGDLFSSAEDLLASAGRRRALLARHSVLADLVGALSTDLTRTRQHLRSRGGGPSDPDLEEATRLVERCLTTLRTMSGWSAEAEVQDDQAWREVTSGAGELSARARALRVVALDTLSPAIERAAGEMVRTLGRPVTVSIRAEGVEIDRRVRDGLREPLLHLVRNAIDHGIEPPEARVAAGKPEAGSVEIEASIAGRDARIVVRDDGKGVDLEALQQVAAARGLPGAAGVDLRDLLGLIFEAGVSTRRNVSAFSGRGVGLDVVRQRIAQLHGRVEVESEPGRGTRFTLTVPVDLSVSPGLVVQVRDVRAIFMATAVERLRRASPEDLLSLEGRMYLRDEGGPVPLADLDAALGLSARPVTQLTADERWACVVVAAGDRRAAFRVDALLDYHEVIVRPLGGRVRRAALVSGAAVLGDGELALVLDAADLVKTAQPAAVTEHAADAATLARRRILVVDDSVTTRQLERTILEAAGYDVTLAHDGQHAWEMLADVDASGHGQGRVDAVLSDIEMPRMDGFQLLARVRATPRTARLPFVLVTALDRPSDRQRALDLGASSYLIKRSFDQEALLETLERLL
ncbi:hybrid sensor histidine kinase/response regulator [Chondromyces apiculatus]|uniref:histidine kinase n=1 Tax=Chondromyces apiculatus DSM 436 TaxID=1192034 RepID=A0A017T5R4_9BACT|nr:response regulator [Chondromyces apiculatus]EYF04593.1 CheA signal transduction histidine kinase [Chondromyces apiculatus DSM 436]